MDCVFARDCLCEQLAASLELSGAGLPPNEKGYPGSSFPSVFRVTCIFLSLLLPIILSVCSYFNHLEVAVLADGARITRQCFYLTCSFFLFFLSVLNLLVLSFLLLLFLFVLDLLVLSFLPLLWLILS